MKIKDDKIKISEVNDEIFELEREIGDMMDKIRTEQIRLEYEQQKEIARNNPSYLGNTFRSVQEFNLSYKNSVNESLLNNGRMKGSRGQSYRSKIKESGEGKKQSKKRNKGAVNDTLCSSNKCIIF